MTNREIYQKTIGFSVRRILWDLLSLLIMGAAILAGALIDKNGVAGVLIGFLIGVVVMVVVTRFMSYIYKAGQIAMMTRGVTEGSLPDHVVAEGKKAVKERFATVAVYYAATRVIRRIFSQIGRGITKIGNSLGGDAGESIGSAISAVINVIVAYLCDCCLGWVFYRKDEKSVKATLQGAALFFRHGKTFIKNMGRVFGLGLISLLLIGGAFFGVTLLIMRQLPQRIFVEIATDLKTTLNVEKTAEWLYKALTDPASLVILASAVAALLIWRFVHSSFVRPFVLVGVLRNYMKSGMEDAPKEDSYAAVAKLSPAFAKEMKNAA